MQRLEVSGAVRPIEGSLGVKGLSSGKRDNLRAISYFRCGVVEAQALSVIINYKFQTKYTSYCLRKQSCLFVE
jgi:hypothetical protein